MANEIMSNFAPTIPLTIHWDEKMLTDTSGKEVVDRLPILVTGDGVQQLLGVPKISSGTGLAMSTAVCETIRQWGLMSKIKVMCFDTTASNTGKNKGACVLVESNL